MAATTTILAFNLPLFFDDVALELLLQPPGAAGSVVDSTMADYKRVVFGTAWGTFGSTRFVIALVAADVAAQFAVPPAVVGAPAFFAPAAKREPIGDVRARQYWRSRFTASATDFEKLRAVGTTPTDAAAASAADGTPDVVPFDDDMLLSEVTAALLANRGGGDSGAEPTAAAVAVAAASSPRRGRAGGAAAAVALGAASPIAICLSPVPFAEVDRYAGGHRSKGWQAHLDDSHREKQRRRPNDYLPRPVAAGDESAGTDVGNNHNDDELDAKRSRPDGGASHPQPKLKVSGDACKKCGSTNHLSRHCPGPGAEGVVPAPSTTAPHEAAPPAVQPPSQPKVKASGDACKKCGSTNHLTRHCPGPNATAGNAAPAPPTAAAVAPDADELAVVRRPPPAAPSAAAVVRPVAPPRASGDACKHCGSADHLSRHCPNKK